MERMRPGAAEMSVSSGESDVRKFETSPLIHTSLNVPSSTSRMRCVMAEMLKSGAMTPPTVYSASC